MFDITEDTLCNSIMREFDFPYAVFRTEDIDVRDEESHDGEHIPALEIMEDDGQPLEDNDFDNCLFRRNTFNFV